MGPELQMLLKLQRLDGRLALLGRELELRPKMHSRKQERLEELERNRVEIHDLQKEIQIRADRTELEGKSLDEKIRDNQVKLGNASTNVEYQGFQTQIARLEEERNEVDSDLLEIWDELEQAQNLERECVVAIEEQRSIVVEEHKELEKELASIREEAKGLIADREAAREPIPAELLDQYDTLFSRHQERSIVPAKEGICGGCHMSLSPQTLVTLKGTKPVSCNSCGRLLYPA